MADEVKRPVPMRSGERGTPIRVGGNSLRSIVDKGAQHVKMMGAMAGHNDSAYLPGVRTNVDMPRTLIPVIPAPNPKQKQQVASQRTAVGSMFAKGQTVYDTVKLRKATVVKLHVSVSKKGTPIHKLIAKNGDTWYQKQTKLEQV